MTTRNKSTRRSQVERCQRINNVYLLEKEYYAAIEQIDPFQDSYAYPCWTGLPVRAAFMIEAWEGFTG